MVITRLVLVMTKVYCLEVMEGSLLSLMSFTDLLPLKYQNKCHIVASTVTGKDTLMLMVVGGSSFDAANSAEIGLMYNITNLSTRIKTAKVIEFIILLC